MNTENNSLHIFELPVEVLICIFEYLDSISLERIADASERFSNIILSSKRLQSNLILNIHSKQYYNDMINHSRKLPYKNINFIKHPDDEIYYDTLESFVIYDILVNLQNCLEKIQIFNIGKFWPLETFAICKNLKELRLIDDHYQIMHITLDVVTFSVLKILEIKCSRDCEILNLIEAPNLKKLIIYNSCPNLKQFLMKTDNLKFLTIYEACADDLQGFDTLKFKLKSLNLGLSNFRADLSFSELNEDRSWTKTLSNFLKNQSRSLDDVSLDFMTYEDNSYEIVKICLSELKLNKFSLKVDENFTKFKNLLTNKSIKILKFEGFMNNQNLKHLISCCPLVTNFTLNFASLIGSNIFYHISNSMSNLKFLEIDSLLFQISDIIILENVEKLKIRLLSQELWHQVAMLCPNLKELELIDRVIEIQPNNLKKVLFKCQKLQILTFDAGMDLVCKFGFFDAFKESYVKVRRINFFAVNFERLFFSHVRLLSARTDIQICCKNNLY